MGAGDQTTPASGLRPIERLGGCRAATQPVGGEKLVSPAAKTARVYVALGSNLGDRLAVLARARGYLASLPDTRVAATSRVFLTAPVGGPEQGPYLNQVVELSTCLSPWELLCLLQQIEAKEGRVRQVRWGPRTLDLDILWYEGFVSQSAELTVPHPRIEERRFVLEPLAELAPDLVLPSGRTVREALALVGEQEVAPLDMGTRKIAKG